MADHQKKREILIKGIEDLPTLPIVSKRIMEIAQDENASYHDLVEIVKQDQALSTQIMKVANSSFYGFLSRVSSLEHALVLLGSQEVISLVLGVSVYKFFSHNGDRAVDLSRFWKHSIICSQVARFLATHFKLNEDDSLFLIGLIHDIGKIVMDQYFHEEFLKIVEYVSKHRTTFSKAEKEILGTTHYQIGATVLKQWKFPKKVIMPIFYHHAPWYDMDNGTNSIIMYLANLLTKMAGFSCLSDEKKIEIDSFVNSPGLRFVRKSGFDLDKRALEQLVGHVQDYVLKESENIMRLFN
jgi:putative nucleotidyltransferase with HDIG domain